MDAQQVRTLPAEEIMQRINDRAGYPLCNRASVHALQALQAGWTTNSEEK